MTHADSTLSHEALPYRAFDQLAAGVRDYLRDAAVAREPVLIALPADHLGPLRDALGSIADGLRLEEMEQLGRNPARLISAYQAWADDHDRPVRVVSEPVWPGRSEVEVVECLRHEALINHLLSSVQVSILCPYDQCRLEPETLAGVALTHPHMVSERGGRRASPEYREPIEVHAGARWPQADAAEPVSEHTFDGDLRALRHAIATDPIVGRLSRARVEDLVFAVNEAASNAIRHADGTCTTRLWHDGTSVVSEVRTDSVLADVAAGHRRPTPESNGGRGLWLINQICDLVELRTDERGTTVRMHMR